ncbi:hypothetical protein BOX15_Mlig006797g1 [Macrostomum lignano]|uniref:Uncharacterized protein n=1 Tax=Macrostomum lignano TaxID=282301 RepID=A0A267GV01_9PLAT|nr:hypothetical protein BOX15_Mlig006797g1 [Macrostomum lignano]
MNPQRLVQFYSTVIALAMCATYYYHSVSACSHLPISTDDCQLTGGFCVFHSDCCNNNCSCACRDYCTGNCRGCY